MYATLIRLSVRQNHSCGALAGLATTNENSYKAGLHNIRTRLRIDI